MKTLLLGLAVAALAIVPALAQETPEAAPATAQVAPGCTVEGDPLIAACVRRTAVSEEGSFAGVEFYVQAADRGWVQLTECTPLMAPCAEVVVRNEDAVQGDGLPLGPVE